MVPTKVLKILLPILKQKCVQAVVCGDPDQLPPFGDKVSPHLFLLVWAEKVIKYEEDYWAAKDPIL